MVLFFTSTICNKSCAVYTSPASISLAICRWCDIYIFNVRNKDVVVVAVVVVGLPLLLNSKMETLSLCDLQTRRLKILT